MPLGAVAPVQTRDAIAMRETQVRGLVVASLVALECDLSFVGLAERAGESVITSAWGRWRWFGSARVSCFDLSRQSRTFRKAVTPHSK